jgi:hypothetical protein
LAPDLPPPLSSDACGLQGSAGREELNPTTFGYNIHG